MFYTFKYKTGFVHISMLDSRQKITYQVDHLDIPIEAKSIRSAKIQITKRMKYFENITKVLEK